MCLGWLASKTAKKPANNIVLLPNKIYIFKTGFCREIKFYQYIVSYLVYMNIFQDICNMFNEQESLKIGKGFCDIPVFLKKVP